CSADLDLGVGNELVGRQLQVSWGRTLPDSSRGVINRAVAWAEPAAILALMGEWDTAEVRADADDHEPLIVSLLDARRVRLRIRKARDIDLLRFLNFLLGAMEDEDRL